MSLFNFECVINTEFGGFSCSDELALLLMDRGWLVLSNKEYDYRNTYPINSIVDNSPYNFFVHDSIELRTHPDLIECVKLLHDKYKDLDWYERRKLRCLDLVVQKFIIQAEVEDYYDGKERVNISIREE